MKNHDVAFTLLFQRLLYPSGMVRERSCVAIAKLLINPIYADSASEHLLDWLNEEMMESQCIFPLLILLRAKEENIQYELPPLSKIEKCVKAPSLLSWMLLNDLYKEYSPALELSQMHSEDLQGNSKEDDFFITYSRSFLPPIYMDMAERIEETAQISFVQQWKGEWRKIVKDQEIELTSSTLDRGREHDKHLVAFDTRMSEAYRSAYLRTLAWAADNYQMPMEDACYMALQACPVDLSLWHLQPSSVPFWFPNNLVSASAIDTSIDRLWNSVNNLWEERYNVKKGYCLSHCSGLINAGDSYIELEIHGIFQKNIGSHQPNLGEIIDWCRNSKSIYPEHSSYLRLGGIISPTDPNDSSAEFEDWIVLPAAKRFRPISTPRWQWWRMYRDIWIPSPFLLTEQCSINVLNNEILFSLPHMSIGSWQAWTDGLAEKRLANIPPAAGENLMISETIIKDYEIRQKCCFCWVVRATVYYRKHQFENFQIHKLEKQWGASSLIIP